MLYSIRYDTDDTIMQMDEVKFVKETKSSPSIAKSDICKAYFTELGEDD
jgi:hypothetical protein